MLDIISERNDEQRQIQFALFNSINENSNNENSNNENIITDISNNNEN